MYITVQFRNRDNIFSGKSYDYEINSKKRPKVGDIIRMYSPDGGKRVCNATRVKVLAVKSTSEKSEAEISYVESSMEEPSIAKA